MYGIFIVKNVTHSSKKAMASIKSLHSTISCVASENYLTQIDFKVK